MIFFVVDHKVKLIEIYLLQCLDHTIFVIDDVYLILFRSKIYYSSFTMLNLVIRYGTDISASPKFEIAFICQFLSATLSITSIAGLDCSFMTTMLHVSAQFKLINTWISNIGTEINCNPNYTQKIKVDLTRCIRHHQRIIQ